MDQVETITQAPVESRPIDEKDETKHVERPDAEHNGVHISKTHHADIAANVDDFWVCPTVEPLLDIADCAEGPGSRSERSERS